jgi:ankyrin repeat protein
LLSAAFSDNIDLATESLDCGADPDFQKGNGWTPLIVSAYNGSFRVLKKLLESGSDVNKTSYSGTTPIMYAMSHYENSGDRLCFEFLKSHGADMSIRDGHSKSIYDYAKERNVVGLFDY